MNNVKPERTLGMYLVILYMVLSILSSVTMFVFAPEWFWSHVFIVVFIITIISIVGLWLMKKWGAALTTVLTGIGIATNMVNIVPLRLHEMALDMGEALTYWWAAFNYVGLVLNSVVAFYVFKWIFADRFE